MSCAARRLELTRELAKRREVLCHLLATFPLDDPRVRLATNHVDEAMQALLTADCSD